MQSSVPDSLSIAEERGVILSLMSVTFFKRLLDPLVEGWAVNTTPFLLVMFLGLKHLRKCHFGYLLAFWDLLRCFSQDLRELGREPGK